MFSTKIFNAQDDLRGVGKSLKSRKAMDEWNSMKINENQRKSMKIMDFQDFHYFKWLLPFEEQPLPLIKSSGINVLD